MPSSPLGIHARILCHTTLVICMLCLGTSGSILVADDDDTHVKHVLFLMSDSHDGRTLDPTDRTVYPAQNLPNMNRLARSGVNFIRTYAHSPQCTPSRSSLYTGRRTDQIKVWANGFGLARDHESGGLADACVKYFPEADCLVWARQQNTTSTFRETLSDAGVNVTIFGKTHVGGNILAEGPPGFDAPASMLSTLARAARIRKPSGDWLVENTTSHVEDVANQSDPLPPWRYNGKTGKDPKTLRACLHALRTLPSMTRQFLHCSFFSPHPPFDSNATYLSRIEANEVTNPPVLPNNEFGMHPSDALASIQKLHADYDVISTTGNVSKTVRVGYSRAQIQEVRRTYYAMGSEVDDWIGLLMDALQQRPDSSSWYVLYLSDHGEHAMEHLQTGKNSMYEASTRVPLLVAGPGIEGNQIRSNMVSLLDIFPTLCDLLGVDRPSFLVGHSLAPLLFGSSAEDHDASRPSYVFAQYHSLYSGTGTYMVRNGTYKLIVYADPNFSTQLFDVAKDPNELHDLSAVRPGDVSKLREYLDAEWDWKRADREARAFQRDMYRKFVWNSDFAKTGGCAAAFNGTAFRDFDEADMMEISAWSDLPCA